MSREQPPQSEAQHQEPDSEVPHQESSSMKILASNRTARALAVVAGLGIASLSSDAEAKKHRNTTSHQTRSHEATRSADAHPIVVKHPSLDAHKDHGLEREVQVAEHLGFPNYKTNADLEKALQSGELVDITPKKDDGYIIDARLGELTKSVEEKKLYTALREYAAQALRVMAKEFHKQFPHAKLHIGSAVRTEEYVDKLRTVNDNVAKAYTSTHLKGIAVDIIFHSPISRFHSEEYQMPKQEQAWLSERLLTLETIGRVQATREDGQPVFHVVFYPPAEKKEISNPMEIKDPWKR